MPWLQLKLTTHPEQAQTLAERLEEAGAVAVTFQDGADQPLYEPPPGDTPLWEKTEITGLFPAETDPKTLKRQLERKAAGLFRGWRIQEVEDKAWSRVWMETFQPMRFGKRLWICPSWCSPPDPAAVNILLDPGLAFGTGTHPTTALCLEWLDAHPPEGKTVIDYGCGSGILAIAAARLGAKEVLAIDTDPQALQATRENAEKNGVARKIRVAFPGEETDTLFPIADLLLANILANPLMTLAERLARRVATGGFIVLSGILRDQAEPVSAAYRPWFDLAPPVVRHDWIRLDGVKKQLRGQED